VPDRLQWKLRRLAENGACGGITTEPWQYARDRERGRVDYARTGTTQVTSERCKESAYTTSHGRQDQSRPSEPFGRLRRWSTAISQRIVRLTCPDGSVEG
jgi:hypothetical protein